MRLFSEEDVERVHLIRSLQETLGCSLTEIKEMLAVEELGLSDGSVALADTQSRLRRAVSLTRSQLSLLSQKARLLEQLRGQLEERLVSYLEHQWPASRSGSSRGADVGIP
jgi:DNA-binding transcriptional MerR regulator